MKVTTLQKVYRCLPAVLDLSCFDNARGPLAASASRGQGSESVHQAPGGADRRPVYPAFWTCTMAAGHLGQYHVCRVYSSRT